MANFSDRMTPEIEAKLEQQKKNIEEFNSSPISEEILYNVNMEQYTERLRTRMRERRIGQAQLASEAAISPQMVSKILNGKVSKINRAHLMLSADCLGCTPHYLIGLVDHPNKYPSKAQSGKTGWFPIMFLSSPESALLQILQRTTRDDPVFVDYICQIITQGPKKVERLKAILLATGWIEPRRPEDVIIPEVLKERSKQQEPEDNVTSAALKES